MLKVFCGWLLTCAVCLPTGSAIAADIQSQSAFKQRFIKPVALRGTLGDETIQVNLRTKAEFEDGVEGDYFVFGHSQKILLAGEIDGEEIFLEESRNGTDVSGQWNGRLAGDGMEGEWQSADGMVRRPFSIRFVHAPEKGRTDGKAVRPRQ